MPRRPATVNAVELERILAKARKSGYPSVRVEWQNAAGHKVTVIAGENVGAIVENDLDRELAEFEAGNEG